MKAQFAAPSSLLFALALASDGLHMLTDAVALGLAWGAHHDVQGRHAIRDGERARGGGRVGLHAVAALAALA